MSTEIVRFDSDNLNNVISEMDDDQIDELAFGVIRLDTSGVVLAFNKTEGTLTGRNPEEMLGKHFFTEVAPCTKTPEFHGRFRQGVEAGELDVMFEYVFDYNMAPTKVKVHMKKAVTSSDFYIFVKRL